MRQELPQNWFIRTNTRNVSTVREWAAASGFSEHIAEKNYIGVDNGKIFVKKGKNPPHLQDISFPEFKNFVAPTPVKATPVVTMTPTQEGWCVVCTNVNRASCKKWLEINGKEGMINSLKTGAVIGLNNYGKFLLLLTVNSPKLEGISKIGNIEFAKKISEYINNHTIGFSQDYIVEKKDYILETVQEEVKESIQDATPETTKQVLTREQVLAIFSNHKGTPLAIFARNVLAKNLTEPEPYCIDTWMPFIKDKLSNQERTVLRGYGVVIPQTYLERQAESGFSIGDKVKVVRDLEETDDLSWTDNPVVTKRHFNLVVGYKAIIKDIHSNGILLEDDTASQFSVPYYVLEKVKEVYKPFSITDGVNLIGKVIKMTKKECKDCLGLITTVTHTGVCTGLTLHKWEELLEKWIFMDGSPCGKLEIE